MHFSPIEDERYGGCLRNWKKISGNANDTIIKTIQQKN